MVMFIKCIFTWNDIEKRGGELGEVKKGQLVPVIDKLVFTAAERILHGPIKSQFGFHLIEVKFRMDGLR